MSHKEGKRTGKLREIWSYHIVIGRFSIFIGIGEVYKKCLKKRKKRRM